MVANKRIDLLASSDLRIFGFGVKFTSQNIQFIK
jgi:hypothetical protein